MANEKLDSIIRKIKGLLATAENNSSSEDEAQAAFVLAQKLMMKYNIELTDVKETENDISIVQGQGTAYKTLYWYERELAKIISKNFRVKHYYNSKKMRGSAKTKRTIMFFGLEHDVQIAKEMYVLANEAMHLYSKRFIDKFYSENNYYREKSCTMELKNSYMRGFLEGLKQKLDSQRFSLQEEFGLILLTPKVVEDSYEEFSKSFGKAISCKVPKIEDVVAYRAGLNDGSMIDYTKSTIDDEIFI